MCVRDFDEALTLLMLNIAPGFLVPNGFKGRSELGHAFAEYFQQYDPKKSAGSTYANMRSATNERYGVTPWNQGRLEVGILLGLLANAIPAISFMIVHIFADANLLRDVRQELESVALDLSAETNICCLKIRTMREKCVILHATFQEVLRLHAKGAVARWVREDTWLRDEILLKKGNIVHISMAVMHSDRSAWGDDVDKFRPQRFLKSVNNVKELNNTAAAAYLPFGGGASLCPGRHFATLEAMALTALLVLQFDASPSDGKWTIPEQRQESLSTNVFPPQQDIEISIRRRTQFKDARWICEMR